MRAIKGVLSPDIQSTTEIDRGWGGGGSRMARSESSRPELVRRGSDLGATGGQRGSAGYRIGRARWAYGRSLDGGLTVEPASGGITGRAQRGRRSAFGGTGGVQRQFVLEEDAKRRAGRPIWNPAGRNHSDVESRCKSHRRSTQKIETEGR